jgi:hypothetical protein
MDDIKSDQSHGDFGTTLEKVNPGWIPRSLIILIGILIIYSAWSFIQIGRMRSEIQELRIDARLEKGWIRLYVGDSSKIDSVLIYQRAEKF